MLKPELGAVLGVERFVAEIEITALGDFLQSHTVLETLEYMNSDARVARDVAAYYEWVPFGSPSSTRDQP